MHMRETQKQSGDYALELEELMGPKKLEDQTTFSAQILADDAKVIMRSRTILKVTSQKFWRKRTNWGWNGTANRIWSEKEDDESPSV